ncbi:hypothetical protein LEP1GSC035_4487 [Leptospira noguchii str. 2007001578]|uniref:Uncharacterized protein n=1 Tax=Leptospira noguchii str. 2007001578 TaxID=1049974 RepID=A0ABP2TCP0_9LEPT|nr:hypothetical protein LEP1GSC035_4487 [Leptospira noguchii str. 2007001578]
MDQCSNRNRYKRYCRKKAIYGTLAVFQNYNVLELLKIP